MENQENLNNKAKKPRKKREAANAAAAEGRTRGSSTLMPETRTNDPDRKKKIRARKKMSTSAITSGQPLSGLRRVR